MKLKISLLTLFLIVGGILFLNYKTISELKAEMELNLAEIAKLEDVIEKQDEKIEEKQSAIDGKDRKIAELEEEINKVIEMNKISQIKLEKPKNSILQVSRVGNQKINVEATAYTSRCKGCIGITKSGYDVRNTIYYNNKYRIIAVDPRLIPLGSILTIEGFNEKFIALDTGGKIINKRIDILFKTKKEALNFGRKKINVSIIGKEDLQ